MKRLFIAASALVAALMAQPVLAADMAVKAPPIAPPPPVLSWTGFYVGLNLGGGFNDTQYSAVPSGCFVSAAQCGGGTPLNPARSALVNFHDTFVTGGAQVGYNWQTGNWVWGLETDINGSSQSKTHSINAVLPAPPFAVGNFLNTATDKMEWFGTFRARAGFLAMPNLLLYGTGGLAYGEVRSATFVGFTATPDVYNGAVSTVRAGWTAGAGGEWMFAPKWSAKLEYLYVDLGTVSYGDVCSNSAACTAFAPPPSYVSSVRVRENIVRGGINYHF